MKDFLLATDALISAATPKSAETEGTRVTRSWEDILHDGCSNETHLMSATSLMDTADVHKCVSSTDPVSHLLSRSKGCWLPADRADTHAYPHYNHAWSQLSGSEKAWTDGCTFMSRCILPVSCRKYKPWKSTGWRWAVRQFQNIKNRTLSNSCKLNWLHKWYFRIRFKGWLI